MQVSNRGMAAWMEVFVEGLSKNVGFSNLEKTAEININDLKKVVWNDETFYVNFKEDGAEIINRFTNVVNFIKGASTIEEVNEALNGQQIVANSQKEEVTAKVDIFEEELKKVSSYRVEADNMNPNDPNQQQNNDFNNSVPQNNQQENPFAPNSQESTDQTQNQVQDIANDIEQTVASLNMLEKISSLEEKIINLTKTITALSEQQYAHQSIPIDEMANQIQQEELNHINETMQAGQQQLNKEYNTDLTTMEGRISLIDQLMNDIDNGDDLADDELKELDLLDNSNPAMEMEMGTSTEFDNKKVEETTELDIEKEEVETPEVETPEVGTNDEVVVEVTEVEEPKIEEEPTKEDDKDTPEEESKGLGIEKLSSKDAKIFQKRICPNCGEEKMFKTASIGSFVGIYCKDCNTEYAVNTDSEEIFIKKV